MLGMLWQKKISLNSAISTLIVRVNEKVYHNYILKFVAINASMMKILHDIS